MSWVVDVSEFQKWMMLLERTFRLEERLPLSVCQRDFYNSYLFSFDEMLTPEFYQNLLTLMERSKERRGSITSLDPLPKDYFLNNWGKYGQIEFTSSMTREQYYELMYSDPGGSPADALGYNSEILCWIGESEAWGCWAERSSGVGLLFADLDIEVAVGTKMQAGMDQGIIHGLTSFEIPDGQERSEFVSQLILHYS